MRGETAPPTTSSSSSSTRSGENVWWAVRREFRAAGLVDAAPAQEASVLVCLGTRGWGEVPARGGGRARDHGARRRPGLPRDRGPRARCAAASPGGQSSRRPVVRVSARLCCGTRLRRRSFDLVAERSRGARVDRARLSRASRVRGTDDPLGGGSSPPAVLRRDLGRRGDVDRRARSSREQRPPQRRVPSRVRIARDPHSGARPCARGRLRRSAELVVQSARLRRVRQRLLRQRSRRDVDRAERGPAPSPASRRTGPSPASSGDTEAPFFPRTARSRRTRAGLSVEPFLYVHGRDGGRLWTWADGTAQHRLEEGICPFPMRRGRPAVSRSMCSRSRRVRRGRRRSRCAIASTNPGKAARREKLFLAVRPLQVNPPSQFLNRPGGASPIHRMARDGSSVSIDGRAAIFPAVVPSGFGAVTFDGGPITDFLSRGTVPAGQRVEDAFGYASAALRVRPRPSARRGATRSPSKYPSTPSAVSLRSTGQPRRSPPRARVSNSRKRRDPGGSGSTAFAFSARQPPRSSFGRLASISPPSSIDRDGPAIRPGTRAYARSWIRDGALMAAALLRWGTRTRRAPMPTGSRVIRAPTGRVPCCVDRRGADPVAENDSHGELLYLLAEVWRYTRDDAWLGRVFPHVEAAVSCDRPRALAPPDRGVSGAGEAGLLRPDARVDQPRGLLGEAGALLLGRLLDTERLEGRRLSRERRRTHGGLASRWTAIRDEFARTSTRRSISSGQRAGSTSSRARRSWRTSIRPRRRSLSIRRARWSACRLPPCRARSSGTTKSSSGALSAPEWELHAVRDPQRRRVRPARMAPARDGALRLFPRFPAARWLGGLGGRNRQRPEKGQIRRGHSARVGRLRLHPLSVRSLRDGAGIRRRTRPGGRDPGGVVRRLRGTRRRVEAGHAVRSDLLGDAARIERFPRQGGRRDHGAARRDRPAAADAARRLRCADRWRAGTVRERRSGPPAGPGRSPVLSASASAAGR